MLVVRLSRIGKKNHAQFRIVLTEDSAPLKGKPVEILGSYDPHSKKISLKKERVTYWIDKGVKFSDTVFNLMVKEGIIAEKKRKITIKQKPKKEEDVKEVPKEVSGSSPKEESKEKEQENKDDKKEDKKEKQEVPEEKAEEKPTK